MTNEPLQSPLRPTVDAARLAEFIADANSRDSAIRGRRMEATADPYSPAKPRRFSVIIPVDMDTITRRCMPE